MKLEEAINKRHSVRKFKSKKVKIGDLLEAIDAAIKSPAAGNIHNLKFVIIDDQQSKNEIAKQSQQFWLSEAQFIILVCSDPTKITRSYDNRGLIYSRQQAGAAIQNFLLRVTDLGLSSCWVGSFCDEIIKQNLKIPENINLEAILPVGYEIKKSKQKPKPALENVINWGSWGVKKKPVWCKDPRTN